MRMKAIPIQPKVEIYPFIVWLSIGAENMGYKLHYCALIEVDSGRPRSLWPWTPLLCAGRQKLAGYCYLCLALPSRFITAQLRTSQGVKGSKSECHKIIKEREFESDGKPSFAQRTGKDKRKESVLCHMCATGGLTQPKTQAVFERHHFHVSVTSLSRLHLTRQVNLNLDSFQLAKLLHSWVLSAFHWCWNCENGTEWRCNEILKERIWRVPVENTHAC